MRMNRWAQAAESPMFCVWELTLACNLRCRHCGSGAGLAQADELDQVEALRVADELAGLGCKRVSLIGGEPFLKPGWEAVVERLAARGVIVELVTNGWMVDSAMVQRMVSAGVHSVSVSIDGTAAVHDMLRDRKGSFERALAAVRNVREAGLPVGVLTQVSKANMGDLERLYPELEQAGVGGWQIQLSMALGRFGGEEQWILSPEQLPELERIILKLSQLRGPWVYAADNIGYMSRNDPLLRESPTGTFCWTGCQAGLHVLGIASDGSVRGCLSLPAEFNEASVRERSLASIWADAGLFQYNRSHKEQTLTGFCRQCVYRRICRGGCTTLRYTTTGGLGENHYCLYRMDQEHPSPSVGEA